MQIFADPLRIYYFLVMDDEDFEDMTPFQGFGKSWQHMHWAMIGICDLPGDVTERSSSPEQIAVQRIAGLRPLVWRPISISTLERIPLAWLPPCLVIFTGQPTVAARIAAWRKKHPEKALHISSIDGQGVAAEDFTLGLLRNFCLSRLEQETELLNYRQRELVAKSAKDWEWPEVLFPNYDVKGHNVTMPNHMALGRLGYTLNQSTPFTPMTEQEYTDAILESAAAVAFIRHEIGSHDVFKLGVPAPGVILFEPAMYRQNYKRLRKGSEESAAFMKAFKHFQKQKGLFSPVDKDFVKFMIESPEAHTVASIRTQELLTQTLGVGLFAAQTTTPVIRLSPGVNHVFPTLSEYARNSRASNTEARRKTDRLFSRVQKQLVAAVGEDRIDFIRRTGGPIQIISDAPIEWLPIDGLPLSFRRDCSRLPVTPGNLFMGELAPIEPMGISPETLKHVLVVSSFNDDDPLKDILVGALNITRASWEHTIKITFASVSTIEQFADALNEFDGEILVFDGHGVANDDSPVSKIAIGDAKLDVWSLRGKVRCPPIVILSACDTHGVDASSHATVGNGFIALGARTVLGTLLPINGWQAAMFISRLMLRLAEYVPAALKGFKRSVPWTDVVSGMLRMSLATEILMTFGAGPDQPEYRHLQGPANHDINVRNPRWFENFLDNIAAHYQKPLLEVKKTVAKVVARSDSIKYTQLGRPDTILISDDSVLHSIKQDRENALSTKE